MEAKRSREDEEDDKDEAFKRVKLVRQSAMLKGETIAKYTKRNATMNREWEKYCRERDTARDEEQSLASLLVNAPESQECEDRFAAAAVGLIKELIKDRVYDSSDEEER